jgi:hypothetical protein
VSIPRSPIKILPPDVWAAFLYIPTIGLNRSAQPLRSELGPR